MTRVEKTQVFMDVAHSIAQLGTCDRAQVGAVIVRDGRCISWGYNGAPPGAPHCEQNNHGWGNTETDLGFKDLGCRNATHAEANAIAFAAKQGISTDGAMLYVTVAPCDVCSRLIIAAGIWAVYYEEEYRDRTGRDILERSGISCLQGYPSDRGDG